MTFLSGPFKHNTSAQKTVQSKSIPEEFCDLCLTRRFLPPMGSTSSSLISTISSCVKCLCFCPPAVRLWGDGAALSVCRDSLMLTRKMSFLSTVIPSSPSIFSSRSYASELLHIRDTDSLIMRTRRSCSTAVGILNASLMTLGDGKVASCCRIPLNVLWCVHPCIQILQPEMPTKVYVQAPGQTSKLVKRSQKGNTSLDTFWDQKNWAWEFRQTGLQLWKMNACEKKSTPKISKECGRHTWPKPLCCDSWSLALGSWNLRGSKCPRCNCIIMHFLPHLASCKTYYYFNLSLWRHFNFLPKKIFKNQPCDWQTWSRTHELNWQNSTQPGQTYFTCGSLNKNWKDCVHYYTTVSHYNSTAGALHASYLSNCRPLAYSSNKSSIIHKTLCMTLYLLLLQANGQQLPKWLACEAPVTQLTLNLS